MNLKNEKLFISRISLHMCREKIKENNIGLIWFDFINFVMQNAAVLLYLACVSFVACFLGEFSVLLLFLVLSFSL
jgi:hypothetical protein